MTPSLPAPYKQYQNNLEVQQTMKVIGIKLNLNKLGIC